MEDFPFNFNLNYKIEEYIVKPPPNLFKLKELSSQKYDIEIKEMVFIPENDEEMVLNNEQNYADLIQYASDHNLTEVNIIINREKEEQDKENDENKNAEEIENNGEEEDEGNYNKYDTYGDTRNRKGNTEEKYNKHNKGFKEKKRIGYIIEKKQMQREETLKNKKNQKNKNEY